MLVGLKAPGYCYALNDVQRYMNESDISERDIFPTTHRTRYPEVTVTATHTSKILLQMQSPQPLSPMQTQQLLTQ